MLHFMPLPRQNVYELRAIYRRFNAGNGLKGRIEQVLLIQSSGYLKSSILAFTWLQLGSASSLKAIISLNAEKVQSPMIKIPT